MAGQAGAITGDDAMAFSWDGVNAGGVVAFDGLPVRTLGDGAGTLEVWFKTSGLAGVEQTILEAGTIYGGRPALRVDGTGHVVGSLEMVNAGDNGNPALYETIKHFGPTITDNQWHYAAISAANSRVAMVVDGSPILDISSKSLLRPNGWDFGHQPAGGIGGCAVCFATGRFNGALDEPAFYARGLSVDDLRRHYAASGRALPALFVGGEIKPGEVYGGDNCASRTVGAAHEQFVAPVDAATGNFWHSFTDLAIPGRMPLGFSRTYNSLKAADTTDGVNDVGLGVGWSSSALASLTLNGVDPTVHQDNGAMIHFTRSGAGPSYTYTAPPRFDVSLTHNTTTSEWTLTCLGSDTFVFEPTTVSNTFRLKSETDANGYTTNYSYSVFPSTDGKAHLSAITDPAGRSLTLTWSGTGDAHLSQVSDPAGRTVKFTYNSTDLVKVEDVGHGFSQFGYDANHRLVTWSTPGYGSGALPSAWSACNVAPPAGVTSNHYGSDGRVDCQADPSGAKTTFGYDYPAGVNYGVTTIIDANGNVEVQHYDSGALTKAIHGYGTAEEVSEGFAYDSTSAGVIKVTDPNGKAWTATYDGKGNRLSSDGPVTPATTSDTFDSFGNPHIVTDGNGVANTYTYNGAGNVTKVERPLLNGTTVVATQTTTYSYDTTAGRTGDVTSMVDPAGKTWTTGYDTYGMPTTATTPDPDGAGPLAASTTRTCYDAVGRRTATIAPLAAAAGVTCASMPAVAGKSCTTPPTTPPDQTVAYVVDDFGRDIVTVNAEGAKTCATFDADGNLLSTQDPNTNLTSFVYDAAGRRTEEHRADSTVTKTTYDALGNVVTQVDGATSATTYAYTNPALPSAPTSVTTPPTATNGAGETTVYGYDDAGNRTTVRYPGGNCATPTKCTTFDYDDAGRLTSILYADPGTPDVTAIEYDNVGRRTLMRDGTDPDGGTDPQTWNYDSLGRLTAHTDAAGQTVNYGYTAGSTQDLRDLVRSITYPGGTNTVTRTFDDAGRMTSVATWLSSSTTSFGYDANSNLTSITYPNGVVSTITPDAQTGAVTGITHQKGGSSLATLAYGRDAAGQVTSMSQTGLPGAASETYGYTALNQIKTVNGQNKYAYDAADNLTKNNGNQQLFDSQANQITSKGGASAATATGTYYYDARGQRTAQVSAPNVNSRTYGFDEAGRMTSFDQSRFVHLSGGNSGFSAAVSSEGAIESAGSDVQGQLGNGADAPGTDGSSNIPVPTDPTVTTPAFKDIGVGFSHTVAMGSDNSVWAWGNGGVGALGHNALTDSEVPVQTVTAPSTPLSGAAEVSAGDRFSVVRKTDGTLWAFGFNNVGQLGQLTSTANTKVAVQVQIAAGVPLSDVATISAGATHVVAVKTDGTVWSWGDNTSGQLGRTITADLFNNSTGLAGADGITDTFDPVPAQVTGLANIAQVSSKNNHTLALNGRGAVYAWGNNGSGQIGDNSTTNRTSPVQVSGLTSGVVHVAAGTTHSLALLGDGTLTAWGNNTYGQLGDNTTTRRLTPVAVTSLPARQIVAVAAGSSTSALITAPSPGDGNPDGKVYTWGRDDRGELGTGVTQTNYLTPTESQLSAGHLAVYAYDGDGLRTTKTSVGPAQRYSYNTAEGLPTLLTYGTMSYITGPGGTIIGQISNTNVRNWYQHDQLGSVVMLTNNSGTITGTASYNAYGGATTTGTTPNIGYTGEWTDTETSLIWLRARMYDPATGQFMSRDPLNAQTQSAYAYADGNPLMFTDPTGLCASRSAVGYAGTSPCRYGYKLTRKWRELVDDWAWGTSFRINLPGGYQQRKTRLSVAAPGLVLYSGTVTSWRGKNGPRLVGPLAWTQFDVGATYSDRPTWIEFHARVAEGFDAANIGDTAAFVFHAKLEQEGQYCEVDNSAMGPFRPGGRHGYWLGRW